MPSGSNMHHSSSPGSTARYGRLPGAIASVDLAPVLVLITPSFTSFRPEGEKSDSDVGS